MRILFACEYFPPFVPGGAEWTTLLQAEALVERGQSVAVVTPNYGAEPESEYNGVHVSRFPWRRGFRGQMSLRNPWNRNPVFYLWGLVHILRAARVNRAEVVHAQNANMLPAAFLAARLLRLPLFVTLRDLGLICPVGALCLMREDSIPADCGSSRLLRACSEWYLQDYGTRSWARSFRVKSLLPIAWVDRELKRAALRRADGVVGVSEGILEVYRRAGILARGKGRVVYAQPPGSQVVASASPDRARWRWGLEGGPVVLYAGKLSPGKGTAQFLEAAERVTVQRPDTVFVIAGKGRLPRTPRGVDVRFLGSIDQAELFDLYALADVVVVPSIWPEPLSRVLLEAAAFGKPCIGTDVGGTPEVILHGETGLLVQRGDVAGLADAVIELLGDGEKRARMGMRGQALVAERFRAEPNVNTLLLYYAERRQIE